MIVPLPMAGRRPVGRPVRRLIALAALILLPLSAGSCSKPAKPLDWCRQEPGRAECLPAACAGRQHTLAVFAAAWCPACQQFGKTLMDADVAARLQSYGRVWIDTDKNGALAEKFEVESIPTTIFFDKDCRPVARLNGAPPVEGLLQALDAVERL